MVVGTCRRVPALDGLRAISILLVLDGHLRKTPGYPIHPGGTWFNTAEIGVGVFFVISGFLITTLLLQERAKSGTISLRGFYFRRTFRILPASTFYILAIAALAL